MALERVGDADYAGFADGRVGEDDLFDLPCCVLGMIRAKVGCETYLC